MEDRGQLQESVLSILWIPGIELKSSGLYNKYFYLLSHLTGPTFFFPRQDLSVNLEFANLVRLASQQAPGTLLSLPLQLGDFHGCCGSELGLHGVWQALYGLRHLPNPLLQLLFNRNTSLVLLILRFQPHTPAKSLLLFLSPQKGHHWLNFWL